MFKLKDNIDLKELEKFDYTYKDMFGAYTKNVNVSGIYTMTILVNVKNSQFRDREIHFHSSNWMDLIISKERQAYFIKELIDAELVEEREYAKIN